MFIGNTFFLENSVLTQALKIITKLEFNSKSGFKTLKNTTRTVYKSSV